MKLTHSDSRRNLFSFPEAKLIEAKMEPTIIGGHYHLIKTEYFILISGTCSLHTRLDKVESTNDMEIGKIYIIDPGLFHEFTLSRGSKLIGLNSHSYNSADDYK